jgi:mono/diheme cytochrome c family protein
MNRCPRLLLLLAVAAWVACTAPAHAAAPVKGDAVDFPTAIQPLLENSCVQCHAKGRTKGGFSAETRESFLKGGDSGPAAVPGKGADSLVVKLVTSHDADEVMPKKGARWTPEQVAALTKWIDQGMDWPANVTFAKPAPLNVSPRKVELPSGGPATHPLDQLLNTYAAANGVKLADAVDDRIFIRRVYMDLHGLPPTPAEQDAFLADTAADKRQALVKKLLANNTAYAEHWLTFWNDLLRNDYKGTGFIDGGRKQITGWLYSSLVTNKPYDQFVRELVNPVPQSEGFSKGIVWRGVVPASMTPPMQAAQTISQAFFGVNLKCASCHDSFTSDWMLADTYGLAAIYSDKPLEMIRCDRPLGKTAEARFLYPQVGTIDPKLPRAERLKRFAELMTSPANGRLPRNIVNRLWARLMGRGLVEPLDDMDKAAWSPDLLDWLAEDLVAHKYDLKRTIGLIATSAAYQLPAADAPAEGAKEAYVFRGPLPRRLTAEQFADSLSTLTGDWGKIPSSIEFDFSTGDPDLAKRLPTVIWTDEPVSEGIRKSAVKVLEKKPAPPAKPDEKKPVEEKDDKPVADGVTPAKKPTPARPANPRNARAPADPVKAAAAADAADKAAKEKARQLLASPELLATLAAAPEKVDASFQPLLRHRVVFRKTFTLDAAPDLAYGAVAASQKVEVTVNGKNAPAAVADRGRSNRQAVLDLRPLLKKGENVIAISVESHTERPNLRGDEREKAPAVFNHLNERSGVAFSATVTVGGKRIEWATDNSWRTCREPADGWQGEKFDETAWRPATPLAEGQRAADDGAVIDDMGRKPANAAVEDVTSRLKGLVAMTTRTGTIRASLIASDPLQLAMDRPNREQVVSCRQCAATTIQALELTNGATLDGRLKKASPRFAAEAAASPAAWVKSLYIRLLCRPPTDAELQLATDLLGSKPTPEATADVVWALLMQPEFQFVH